MNKIILLLCTLLLILFGSSETWALLPQNRTHDEAAYTQKTRVMGYAAEASGRLFAEPQLRLQLAMGYRSCGDKTASGQGMFLSCDPLGHDASMDLYSYCGGDPINSFDADGRLQSGFSSGQKGSIDAGAPNSFAFSLGVQLGGFQSGGAQWGSEFNHDLANDGYAIVTSPWTAGQNIGGTLNNGTFFQTLGRGGWRIGQSAYNIYDDPSIAVTNGSAAYQNLSTPQGGADAVAFLASVYIPGKIASDFRTTNIAPIVRARPLPAGEAPYQLTLFPDVPYNRTQQYGYTPTATQRASVPTGMEFDHDPTLVQHYYEGPGDGSLPGFNLTQTEREAYAASPNSGSAATPAQQRAQGGAAAQYSKQQKKQWGF